MSISQVLLSFVNIELLAAILKSLESFFHSPGA